MHKIWITKKTLREAEKELDVKFLKVWQVHDKKLIEFCPVEVTTHSDFLYNFLQEKLNKETGSNLKH